MRPPPSYSRAWLRSVILFLVGLVLQAPIAAGQQPRLSPSSDLSPNVRSRLAEAAGDSRLEPWQREFMLEVARHGTGGNATRPTPALHSGALRTTGTAADDGAWTAVGVPPPTARYRHTAIYDPVRDRMVVFGGLGGGVLKDVVWALSLAGSPAWTEIKPGGTPLPARFGHTAIYDPVRDRMVIFGGVDGSNFQGLNDVWALSLAGTPTWSILVPTGTTPSARSDHTAIYDPVGDRMLVFGGVDGSGYLNPNDVWALSLAGTPAWSVLVPTGTPPSARYQHTAIYDPVRDRMVVFGGLDGSGFRNDVWELSFAGSPAWSTLTPAGTPPSARFGHAATYDPVRDRMVVFGGKDGGSFRDDMWALSLANSPAWSALAPSGIPPSARFQHTLIYDPMSDLVVAFGGNDGRGGLNDVWALSLAGTPGWSAPIAGGNPPPARARHTAIYDSGRDRMVVFGGYSQNPRNDVWALSLTGSLIWSQLAPAGTPPSPRYDHTAIYDPVRDRMVVFGGNDGSYRNDVWALSLAGSSAWSLLAPTGTPPASRYGHTAIYDSVGDRMLVFGGYVGSYRNDVHALSLAGSPAWSTLTPAGTPPSPRSWSTAIYDPVRHRMLVLGGFDGTYRGDMWALSLAGSPAWNEIVPAGTPPPPRYGPATIYDPMRDRMVIFGGYQHDGAIYLNDVWAISLAGSPAWSLLAPAGSPPSARYRSTGIYDPARDHMVVFGGLSYGGSCNDVWALKWAAGASVAHDVPGRLELSAPRPNPSRRATVLGFKLREPGRVVVDVFDVHGRRVKRIIDDWFPAGSHVRTWLGDDDRGHPVGSGVYVIQLHEGDFSASRPIVRIQ